MCKNRTAGYQFVEFRDESNLAFDKNVKIF